MKYKKEYTLSQLTVLVDEAYEKYDQLFDLRDRGYLVSRDELKKAEDEYDYYLKLYKDKKGKL